MLINTANVTYSSIVQIGENISKLEQETGDKYLKLHRGVMDVTHIDINYLNLKLDLNNIKLQQYSGNDGYSELIDTIKNEFNLNDSNLIITPGGMASLDLIINSLGDNTFWVPNYHWGSWNKILKTHNKQILTFDDFNLENFKPTSSVVMLCYPSNPTGFIPKLEVIIDFLKYAKENNVIVILDLPYYYLFNDNNNELSNYFYDNVIVLSSFSKSIGLSGYRVGYIATKNNELYQTLRIRSLYKYNSISTLPQYIINELLKEKSIINQYKNITKEHIQKNINYLNSNGLLFSKYTELPTGPFAIVKLNENELLKYKISSVSLDKFTINKKDSDKEYSRISVAVNHDLFKGYFDKINNNILTIS
jgi:aspartate aminotransferase